MSSYFALPFVVPLPTADTRDLLQLRVFLVLARSASLKLEVLEGELGLRVKVTRLRFPPTRPRLLRT